MVLNEPAAPSTALVTQECQLGAIGPDAVWPALRDAARPVLGNIARLAASARASGVVVIHCTVAKRPDLRGSNGNAPLFGASTRLVRGSGAVSLVPELGPEPGDIVLERRHGVSPLRGTGLDPILRNLGVRTIVATGVSVNVAIWSLCMDALNAGYRVLLPVDAVAGVPPDYAARVVETSLGLLATLTTTGDVVEAWEAKDARGRPRG